MTEWERLPLCDFLENLHALTSVTIHTLCSSYLANIVGQPLIYHFGHNRVR